MAEVVLEAERLKKVFISGKRTFTAVDGVSFRLERGRCLGIVGESGSGKTTVARMVTRLLDVTDGSVRLTGEDVTRLRGRNLRRVFRQIQMVFQTPAESFDPRRTLGDGIGESLRNAGMSRQETGRRVKELLFQCGLPPEFAQRYPYQASGGECQRAAIARALAAGPSVLVCDEATSALDVTVQKQILELLIRLRETENLSFLLISHDLALVQALCDEVLVLQGGRMVEYGTPEEIIRHPGQEYTRMLVESVLQV